MQLMGIQWIRPSFLPADATFLGRARAVVQLLLQQAMCEGAWKMGKFMAFSQHLIMQVTLELCTLLKIVPKVHLEL